MCVRQHSTSHCVKVRVACLAVSSCVYALHKHKSHNLFCKCIRLGSVSISRKQSMTCHWWVRTSVLAFVQQSLKGIVWDFGKYASAPLSNKAPFTQDLLAVSGDLISALKLSYNIYLEWCLGCKIMKNPICWCLSSSSMTLTFNSLVHQ